MKLLPLPHKLHVNPPFPVEIAVSADGETLTVAIEWPIVAGWLGAHAPDDASVRHVLHERRHEIERVLEAHLFAQGTPLSGEVTLTADDFRA